MSTSQLALLTFSSYQPSDRSIYEDEDSQSQDDERELKRRRLDEDTSHADHPHSHGDFFTDTPSPSSPLHGSHSFPRMTSTLGHMFGGQGNFLGHSRDLINIAMSTHTAQALLPRLITVVQDLPLPGLSHIIDYLPVASADSSHFMGWREKTDTWPTGGCRYLNRSYTSPR